MGAVAPFSGLALFICKLIFQIAILANSPKASRDAHAANNLLPRIDTVLIISFMGCKMKKIAPNCR